MALQKETCRSSTQHMPHTLTPRSRWMDGWMLRHFWTWRGCLSESTRQSRCDAIGNMASRLPAGFQLDMPATRYVYVCPYLPIYRDSSKMLAACLQN
ncbi:hypothetical protein LZ31DRAFT_298970 [Colletotrichum somersetense]|nr:hypothetical protein LZ31DRAFT_298970 [Colletotrichum somersetense]